MDLNLKGKVAIVTGAGRGIGEQIALSLAREGATVVACDIDLETASATAEKVREMGGKGLAVQADVSNRGQVDEMVATALEEFGQIHILVNNATALPSWQPFAEEDEEIWTRVIDVCFYGTLNCTKAVIGHMIENRYGRIVSMASDAGKVGEGRLAVYSGAKAAIIGFSKALAQEVGRHNIAVNVVAPGTTKTPPVLAMLTEEREQKMRRRYPLRRLGEPIDIARAVTFLASDAASFITGQPLSVNGGYCMV